MGVIVASGDRKENPRVDGWTGAHALIIVFFLLAGAIQSKTKRTGLRTAAAGLSFAVLPDLIRLIAFAKSDTRYVAGDAIVFVALLFSLTVAVIDAVTAVVDGPIAPEPESERKRSSRAQLLSDKLPGKLIPVVASGIALVSAVSFFIFAGAQSAYDPAATGFENATIYLQETVPFGSLGVQIAIRTLTLIALYWIAIQTPVLASGGDGVEVQTSGGGGSGGGGGGDQKRNIFGRTESRTRYVIAMFWASYMIADFSAAITITHTKREYEPKLAGAGVTGAYTGLIAVLIILASCLYQIGNRSLRWSDAAASVRIPASAALSAHAPESKAFEIEFANAQPLVAGAAPVSASAPALDLISLRTAGGSAPGAGAKIVIDEKHFEKEE